MKPFRDLCLKLFFQAGLVIILPSFIACIPGTNSNYIMNLNTATAQIVASKRIYVYKDQVSPENRGYWTNMMVQDGAVTTDLIRFFTLTDKSNPFGVSGEAIRIDFELHPLEWAGVAVASCPNCWGRPPCPQSVVYTDLKGANRLVFYARGERGGEVIQAKVAITGSQPCGDSAPLPAGSGYIRLTNEWKQYSIDLRNFDLSRVITPFAIVLGRDSNDQSIRVFLDEIYFEMP